jgi:uncharacterized membrane protein (UPF0182 family)
MASPRRKKVGPLPLTIATLFVIGAILVSLSGFYADILWFRSVNFSSVWKTTSSTKAELFLAFGLLTSLIISSNIYLAHRNRPIYVPTSIEADNIERYRGQLDPIKRYVLIAVSISCLLLCWNVWITTLADLATV